MDQKPKIALVGIGRWGKNLLKEFNEQAEVVWVCHKDSVESDKFLTQNYPNIKSTTLLEDVLDDPLIEAVVVATPTSTHFDIAKKVILSNKHLFLEKPGCLKSSELEEIYEKMEKRKLVFAVGYEFIHHPALKKIKELIRADNIEALFFEWNKWGTFEAPIVPHLLSHDISIIKSLGINSIIPRDFENQKMISEADIIRVKFDNDKNIVITSYINRISINENKNIVITGTKESYIWNNNNLFKIDAKNKTFSPIDTVKNNPVTEEIKDFLESIKGNKKPLSDGNFALEVWKVLDKLPN